MNNNFHAANYICSLELEDADFLKKRKTHLLVKMKS